jgi:DNA polymerase delta subunit 2
MKQPIKTASVDTAGSSLGAGAGDKKPKKVYGYDSSTYSAAPTAQLDNFLAEVLETVDVDLMCGALDPVGITLPQQALHESLLPTAGKFEGFKRTTNPCWFEVAGRRCARTLAAEMCHHGNR